MKAFCFFLICLAFSVIADQTLSLKQATFIQSNYTGLSVWVDPTDGARYYLGQTDKTSGITSSSLQGVAAVEAQHGDVDLIVFRVEANDAITWYTHIGSSSADVAGGIVGAGLNILVMGSTSGTINTLVTLGSDVYVVYLDKLTGARGLTNLIANTIATEAVITPKSGYSMALDSLGTTLWTISVKGDDWNIIATDLLLGTSKSTAFGGTGTDTPNTLVVQGNNVYVGGNCSSEVAGEKSYGTVGCAVKFTKNGANDLTRAYTIRTSASVYWMDVDANNWFVYDHLTSIRLFNVNNYNLVQTISLPLFEFSAVPTLLPTRFGKIMYQAARGWNATFFYDALTGADVTSSISQNLSILPANFLPGFTLLTQGAIYDPLLSLSDITIYYTGSHQNTVNRNGYGKEYTSRASRINNVRCMDFVSFTLQTPVIIPPPLYTTSQITSSPLTTAQMTTAQMTTAQMTTSQMTTAEMTTAQMTTAQMTTAQMTTSELTTSQMTTAEMTTAEMTTAQMTTAEMTTSEMTTSQMTTAEMTTSQMTTAEMTTSQMTTAEMTTAEMTTSQLTTLEMTTAQMTTAEMTTAPMTTAPEFTTSQMTTAEMTTAEMTTAQMTTAEMTTAEMTTAQMTTSEMTTAQMTTSEMTTAEMTTAEMTTAQLTTAEMTTAEMTTAQMTTAEMTTSEMTTAEMTTAEMTTAQMTTAEMTTAEMTTAEMTTAEMTTSQLTSAEMTTAPEFTTSQLTSAEMTTAEMTTAQMTTAEMTTAEMTTAEMTTAEMTSAEMTTSHMTTSEMTTAEMTTAQMTTAEMTSAEITSSEMTTSQMTTAEMTTAEMTTSEMTTSEMTTAQMTTAEMTTAQMTTSEMTSAEMTTAEFTSAPLTTSLMTTSKMTTSQMTTSQMTTAEITTSEMTTAKMTTSRLTTSRMTTSKLTTAPFNPGFTTSYVSNDGKILVEVKIADIQVTIIDKYIGQVVVPEYSSEPHLQTTFRLTATIDLPFFYDQTLYVFKTPYTGNPASLATAPRVFAQSTTLDGRYWTFPANVQFIAGTKYYFYFGLPVSGQFDVSSSGNKRANPDPYLIANDGINYSNGAGSLLFSLIATNNDGEIKGDPIFYGFNNQLFEFNGVAGSIYNVYNDPYVNVDSYFGVANTITNKGSVMTRIGVIIGGHEILVDIDADHSDTYFNVEIDGEETSIDSQMTALEGCVDVQYKTALLISTLQHTIYVYPREATHRHVNIPYLNIHIHQTADVTKIGGVLGQTSVASGQIDTVAQDFVESSIFETSTAEFYDGSVYQC